MLLLIDRPRHLQVVRHLMEPSGKSRRELLGKVAKADLQVDGELAVALTSDERDDLEHGLAVYREAENAKRRAAALTFPATLRLVLEYLGDAASEHEKKIIVMAITEAVNSIRKVARQGAGPAQPQS